MSKPRILDLFCCQGGAGMGYSRAGFDVYGVDIDPQPRYPFAFHQGDALDVLHRLISGEAIRFEGIARDVEYLSLADFAVAHASPPCQARTTMSNRYPAARALHPQLIAPTRDLLAASNLPYIIENVGGARGDLKSPIVLDGRMFGLGVTRPRLFESTVSLVVPSRGPRLPVVGVYGKYHDGRTLWTRRDGTRLVAAATLEEGRRAMGMPWASWRGLTEAIPPAYTEFIGRQLLEHLAVAA